MKQPKTWAEMVIGCTMTTLGWSLAMVAIGFLSKVNWILIKWGWNLL